MKKFECTPAVLDDVLYSVGAETIDSIVGTLLDSAVYSMPAGVLFCFENYLNAWSSDYVCYFFPAGHDRGIERIWEKWDMLRSACSAVSY